MNPSPNRKTGYEGFYRVCTLFLNESTQLTGWTAWAGYVGSPILLRQAEKLLTDAAWGSASHGHG
jgi:hypothetical protein